MTADVYVDLLFFLNAGMDALCLCLTAKLLHRPLSLPRLLASAALGGVYAVISLFLTVGPTAALCIDLSVCLLMCAIALGQRRNPLGLLPGSVAFLVLSMVMGGIMTALYHLLGRLNLPVLTDNDSGDGISAFLFVALAIVGSLITLGGGRFFRRSAATTACRVTVTLDGRSITLDGMVDSGNLLRDPIGGRPVMVVDTHAFSPILSPAMTEALDDGSLPLRIATLPEAHRIRMIPTDTATGQGLLVALRPDAVTVTPEGKPPHPTDCLLALTPLSSSPAQALLPSELMA